MTKIKIINNAGNIYARRLLKNYSCDETSAYIGSQKAHWLKNHEGQFGYLSEEFGNLKISIGGNHEFFDSIESDLFEVVE